jgi:hypothetical protein
MFLKTITGISYLTLLDSTVKNMVNIELGGVLYL